MPRLKYKWFGFNKIEFRKFSKLFNVFGLITCSSENYAESCDLLKSLQGGACTLLKVSKKLTNIFNTFKI